MDRRNEVLTTGSLYWVKDLETGKGFTVYSKAVLDAFIERTEDFDSKYYVQLRRSAEF
jgi:hypothetical protein